MFKVVIILSMKCSIINLKDVQIVIIFNVMSIFIYFNNSLFNCIYTKAQRGACQYDTIMTICNSCNMAMGDLPDMYT